MGVFDYVFESKKRKKNKKNKSKTQQLKQTNNVPKYSKSTLDSLISDKNEKKELFKENPSAFLLFEIRNLIKKINYAKQKQNIPLHELNIL